MPASLRHLALCSAVSLAFGCAHGYVPAPGFQTRFAIPARPTLLLITPTWSDRGLAMLEQLRQPLTEHPELQLVVVVLDDLPPALWRVAAKALRAPGLVRRPQGLGLEGPPFGPVREVPLLFWVDEHERIWRQAVGFLPASVVTDVTKTFMEMR
jgi:hypothetical protein